ncbi:MAG: propionyl-CoA synthetase [Nitrospira sp.]|nr:propionyl-CoA synthetase [bacterium]MBL7050230.1 propionyl-CoA synthetase [Nitrospira sp.]
MGKYEELFHRSIHDREGFWGEAAEGISWYKRWDRVLDDSNKPFYRWFTGGELNTCYNALDRHLEDGRGNQTALIYDSPVTDQKIKYTYSELTDEVARFAGVLKDLGVSKGDTVIIYMPMIPQAAMAMLACARLGAVHSVVFGGFAPHELAIRIDDARPSVIVTASGAIEGKKTIAYKPLINRAIELAEYKPDKCIVYQRSFVNAEMVEGRDYDWDELMSVASPAECVAVKATDPLYILYTSGTTGKPKGIVRDNGGHAVALKWSMKNVYNIDPGDTFWSASDVGWVVGHSYIVYGPLLHGCTTVFFEGKPVGTPDPGAFWRVISEYKVKALFTAPTAFRAIKRDDPDGSYLKGYDLSHFRCLFLAGERLDPDTYYWATRLLDRPVIDHWWQTETGWPITSNCMGIEELPVKPGSSTMPVPGFDVKILDAAGNKVEAGKEGLVAVKLPLPPGTLPTLWQAEERFLQSYINPFPGYYFTSDGGYIDEDGYVFVMGRVDDVINVAGHRLSTGEMEEIVSTHQDVAECAVIGVEDQLKGQVPVGLMVLKAGVDLNEEQLKQDLIKMIREEIGAIANFKQAVVVKRLPKTRSGKILRAVMRKIADSKEFAMPSTIDDPVILDEIKTALKTIGYAQ